MKNHSIRLIDGNFDSLRAKNLLIELLNHKINFHKLEKFSNEIRFGSDLDHSAKRIQELESEKKQFLEWIEHNTNCNIKINAHIQLEAISENEI